MGRAGPSFNAGPASCGVVGRDVGADGTIALWSCLMSLSLNGLIRGLFCLVAFATLTAIGMSRLAPKPTHFRLYKKFQVSQINTVGSLVPDPSFRILDPETGEVRALKREAGDMVDLASSSPWEDEEGRLELVGRWIGRGPDDALSYGRGIARIRYPDGEVLERIPLDVMPMSRPLFDPEDAKCILFSAGDGKLYRYRLRSFQSEANNSDSESESLIELKWKAKSIKTPFVIHDPVWPRTPELQGRMICVLGDVLNQEDGNRLIRTRLGWIELNSDRTEIVDAGLIQCGGPLSQDFSSTTPSLPEVCAPMDGVPPQLAYLTNTEPEAGWSLWVAPLKITGTKAAPLMDASEAVRITDRCTHMKPEFSSTGTSLFISRLAAPTQVNVQRFAIATDRPSIQPKPLYIHFQQAVSFAE